jgi:tRNA(fMet)-specific endonuclease VapC
MKFLLDTDTCIFWLRGNPNLHAHLTDVRPKELAISSITLAELRYGAAYSERPNANHQAIDDFIRPLNVIGLKAKAADVFGDMKADLRRKGLLIEDMDLLIAATAYAYELTLVTNNSSHFERIVGLRLENWILQ